MTQPIDEVYVDIHARGTDKAVRDVKRAAAEMERDVDKATRDIDKTFAKMFGDIAAEINDVANVTKVSTNEQKSSWSGVGDTINKSYVSGTRNAEDAITELAGVTQEMLEIISSSLKKQEKAWQSVAKTIRSEVASSTNEASDSVERAGRTTTETTNTVRRETERAGFSIFKMFSGLGGGDGKGGVLSGLTEQLQGLGQQFAALGRFVPPPMFLAIAAAIPVVMALGGAIFDLAGAMLALPAAIGVGASIMATFQIATNGVGEALKALKTGNAEKIAKAMKELAPNAQLAARDIFKMGQMFESVQKTVQQNFFAPLTRSFSEFGKSVFPLLRKGLGDLATSLGNAVDGILSIGSLKSTGVALTQVFAGAKRIVDNLTPSVVKLFSTLTQAAGRGTPFVERAFAALGRGIDRLTGFLDEAMASGDFEKWLNEAFAIASDLGDLLEAIGVHLATIFGGVGDEGGNVIQTLTKMVKSATEFFGSDKGQEFINSVVKAGVFIVKLIGWLNDGAMAIIGFAVGVAGFFGAVGSAIGSAASAVGGFFMSVGSWIASAWTSVTGFFTSLGGFFASIPEKIGAAFSAIGAFFTRLGQWFTELPGKISAGIEALPGMFARAVNAIAYAVGFAIGKVIKFFIEAPGKIRSGIATAITFVTDVFNRVRTAMINIVTSAVTNTINFMKSVPGRISSAISTVVSVVSRVFTSVRDTAVRLATAAVTNTVNFFRQLPGRVISAITSLPGRVRSVFNSIASGAANIGRNIVNGIANGIRSGVGYVIDVARGAARSIINGMMDALRIGSPSKLAADSVGVPIMQGVGVGVDEQAPSTVRDINAAAPGLIPSGDSGSSSNSGTSSVITFGSGAIQLIFSGVPTQQEAYAAGRAVGSGISDTLATRSTRTAVRVV